MLKRLFGKSDKPAFVWREVGDRLSISLVQSDRPLPFSSWASVRPDAANALNELCSLGDLTGQSAEPAVAVESDCILLAPCVVARLDAPIATIFGLPAPTPLALELRAQNRIDQDDFRLVVRWVRPGGQPVRAQMKGAILFTDAGPRRVPEPLWSLHDAALPLTRSLEKSERFEALARLKEHWPEDPRLALESEGYLQDLRVHYASSLSLKLKTLTPDRTEFDPVLFSARSAAAAEEAGQPLDEDEDSILSSSAQKLFATDRFRRESEVRPVYVLRNGEYLFIDPSLRPALNAVRNLQDAPEKERRAFVLNPRKVLRETLGDETSEQIGLEHLFIETEQFSERVAGVDVWRAPVLPWIVPSEKNKWIPEKFGLRVGEDYFAIPSENVAEVIKRVDEAAEAGASDAYVPGLLHPVEDGGPPPPARIPVNPQSRAALDSLKPFVHTLADEDQDGDKPSIEPAWDAATQGKLFLVVRDNFEEVEFSPVGVSENFDTDKFEPVAPPQRLSTTLKSHQIER